MKSIFNLMLDSHDIESLEDARLAIKECVQEIILCGLARDGFFEHATFYGGSSLRILYNLNRFSEDLDFVLTKDNPDFNFQKYFSSIINELKSLGLNFEIEQKSKNVYTNVLSANVKGNLKSILDTFFEDYDIRKNINKEEVINVKIDIATNPIKGGTYCFKIVDLPEMFQVRTYDLPSLFADKICACLVRGWKTRVKGRDYFDFAFFIRRKVKVNMSYLRKLLIGSKLIDSNTEFNIDVLKSMLIEKFNSLNYEAAKADISVYIKNQNLISLWSKEFFIDLTEKLTD